MVFITFCCRVKHNCINRFPNQVNKLRSKHVHILSNKVRHVLAAWWINIILCRAASGHLALRTLMVAHEAIGSKFGPCLARVIYWLNPNTLIDWTLCMALVDLFGSCVTLIQCAVSERTLWSGAASDWPAVGAWMTGSVTCRTGKCIL